MIKNISITDKQLKSLMGLVDDRALVCQYPDELLNVAEQKDKIELIERIQKASELYIADRVELQNRGFDELVDWSNDNDTLIVIDQDLLICIPKSEYIKLLN